MGTNAGLSVGSGKAGHLVSMPLWPLWSCAFNGCSCTCFTALRFKILGNSIHVAWLRSILAPSSRAGKKQDLTHFMKKKKKKSKYFYIFTNSRNGSHWFVTMSFNWKLFIAQWVVNYFTVLRIHPSLLLCINEPSKLANTLKKCFNWIFY